MIQVTDTITTPGIPAYTVQVQQPLRIMRSLDLKGKRVLDIGCRDGLFSFLAEQMGAEEVIGIDSNLSLGATELLIPYFGSRVKMVEMNVVDLTPETFGTFDFIVFTGILYHLRYPMWSLNVVSRLLVPGGRVLIETGMLYDDEQHALLYCPFGPEQPYDHTSVTFFNRKGLTDTLYSLGIEIEQWELLNSPVQDLRSKLRKMLDVLQSKPQRVNVGRGTFLARRLPEVPDPEAYAIWNGIYRFSWQSARDANPQPSTT
jgi:SAM-dependent methyltransferase